MHKNGQNLHSFRLIRYGKNKKNAKQDFIFSSSLHLKPLARAMGQGEFLCTVKHNATKEKPTWQREDTS